MDTLPPEVYSEIVQVLQPQDKRPSRYIVPAEVVLSQVSTGWRNLAFSNSKSWERVEIYSPKTLPRAAAYVSRSAGAAIYFRIDIYDYEFKHAQSHGHGLQSFISSLADILQSAAPRCKSILIFAYFERTAQQLAFALSNVNAPLLQSLRINTNEIDQILHESENPILPTAIFANGAESLKFVELETPSFPPLHQLVTLHLHNASPSWFTFEGFANLAKEATSLENLSLTPRDFITNWPIHRDSAPITMESLSSLRIIESHPGLGLRVLLSVNAPNLKSLSIASPSTAFSNLFNAPQIQRSNGLKWPKLEYLTLESFNMQDSIEFARTFSTITHLHLSYLLTFFFLRFAEDTLIPEPLWPNLHTLIIEISRDTHSQKLKEGLSRIVSTRRERGLPIPRVLGDADVLQILNTSDFLNETVNVQELNTQSYREPWWLMNHEKSTIQIGML